MDAYDLDRLEDRLVNLEISHAVLRSSTKKDLDSLDSRVDLRFIAVSDAHKLETVELARRLDILNGEAGRIKENQALSVLRQVYDRDQTEMWKAIIELKEFKANVTGRQAILAVVVSAIVSVLVLSIGSFINKL